MNYRAACPHCGSVFRLGDDQLAAAQGWVQCGVCGAAFDARLSLLMENGSSLPLAHEPEPVAPPPEPAPPEPAPAEAFPDTEPETAAAPAQSPIEEAAPVPPETPAAEADEATPEQEATLATEMPRGIREREDALDLPSIILIDPNLPTYDEPGPMPVIKAVETAEAPSSTGTHADTPVIPPVSPVIAPPSPAARIEYAQPQPGTARVPAGPRRLKPWVWIAASLLLLVVLAAQTAYFLRDTLATQWPQTRPLFDKACAVLGCTLSLPRDLDQLQIVGSDLQTEAGGRLRLTLTLGNRSDLVQTWPVLVLTLTDQAGRPLARRSFAPSEYLGDVDRIAAGMPPRTEQPLDLPLTVRDLAPMGFDLKLTY